MEVPLSVRLHIPADELIQLLQPQLLRAEPRLAGRPIWIEISSDEHGINLTAQTVDQE